MTEEMLERAPESENYEDGEAASDTRQFVAFLVGGEVFAVDMAPVQEIIRVPEVVRVPLAPPALEGLSNLRGRVLPIISLRRLFSFPEKEHDDSTRAVVIDLGHALGFIVDRVASVISVEPRSIENVEGIRSTVNSELLTGIIKDAGGFKMMMVLDFARLIAREFADIAALEGSSAPTATAATDDEDDDAGDELQLVSFSVSGQEYAIDIADVQEIVQAPESIVHTPNSPPHVLGLMTLRERILPLVGLRSLFNLPEREIDETSRIVVVTLGSSAVGIVTDSVSEVLRVPASVVEAMPVLLAKDGELSEIDRICRLNDGKRLVSIISVENMFRNAAVKDSLKAACLADGEDRIDAETNEDLDGNDEEQTVVFRLADGEFGVPVGSVQEIVRVPDELMRVPKAPRFVEGVINLRGTVLPVIDQRKRLDLPAIERNDRQRIIVFVLDGVHTGFIVDAVSEVLKIPKSAIEPSPRLSAEQSSLLGRVANLEKQKRMIQLIEPAHLVDATDTAALAAMTE